MFPTLKALKSGLFSKGGRLLIGKVGIDRPMPTH